MRFNDLFEAGRALTPALESYRDREDVVVIGIAFGGVPVAFEVARHLRLPLDVLFIRRLLVPAGKQAAASAVNVCGKSVLEEGLSSDFADDNNPIKPFVAKELEDLERIVQACRAGRAAHELRNRRVLLVDNGICTGSTLHTALGAIRKLGARQIDVAVPGAAKESRSLLESIADKLICLAFIEPFPHVGMFYKKLRRPDETEVARMLNQANLSTP
jgi:putative phosphoribosyl transferase